MPQIKMDVYPNGRVNLEGIGFEGPACQIPLQTFAAGLGADGATLSRSPKMEMTEDTGVSEQSA